MGHSRTYNVLGLTLPDAHGIRGVYPAMSRVDMAQVARKAERDDGRTIVEWRAQTETGEKLELLGPSSRTVTCAVCEGRGCPVCNWSGVCAPGHWRRWQDWQIDEMSKRYA